MIDRQYGVQPRDDENLLWALGGRNEETYRDTLSLISPINYVTPERRINDILSAIEQLMQPSRELVPFFAPNSYSMSLKSSLEFKYRPTVKYEVELYKGAGEDIGALSVLFRTQSQPLISGMTEFFRLWVRIESVHLAPRLGAQLSCSLYDGRFLRPIALPRQECSAAEIAEAIEPYGIFTAV